MGSRRRMGILCAVGLVAGLLVAGCQEQAGTPAPPLPSPYRVGGGEGRHRQEEELPTPPLPSPYPSPRPQPTPRPTPSPTPTMAPGAIEPVFQELSGIPGYPLYLATKTAYGMWGFHWLDDQAIVVRIAHSAGPGGGNIGPGFNTAILNREQKSVLVFEDNSINVAPNQFIYDNNQRHLAYATDSSLWIADLDGQNQRQLATGPDSLCGVGGHMCYGGLSFSPGGQWLTYLDCTKKQYECSAIRVVDVDTDREVYSYPEQGSLGIYSWSPNGRFLAFLTYTAVRVVDMNTVQEVYVYSGEGFQGAPTWSPDSQSLAFFTNFVNVQPETGDVGTLDTILVDLASGQERQLPSLSSPLSYYASPSLHWLSQGQYLLLCTLGKGIWLGDSNSLELKQLPGPDCGWPPPIVSATGEWMAYQGDWQQTFLYNLSSEMTITITAQFQQAIWSPDGNQVVIAGYERGISGERRWLIDVNTGEQIELPLPELYLDPISWSPDGRWLAYVTKADSALWLFDLEDGEQLQIAPEGTAKCASWGYGFDSVPKWSHDGHWIAFTGQDCELYLVDVSQLDP